jgi:RNA polymerase sigma-70 factor (ECF subfamily)
MEVSDLARAVSRLPERRRAILLAASVDGLPHQEIAGRWGISRRTVLVELRRALDFLESELQED